MKGGRLNGFSKNRAGPLANYGAPHHNGHSGYYTPQQPSSYGPVYYPVNQGGNLGHRAAYDDRKRGYDMLNDFFSDVKRRQIDPTSCVMVNDCRFNIRYEQITSQQ
jgi:hypothetical protein